MAIEAVVFDMDGVLADTEHVWDEVRRQLAVDHGGTWADDAHHRMMGMSSLEWSQFMADELHVALAPADISTRTVERMTAFYEAHGVPMIPGAVDAVRALSAHYPLAVASSSNRPIIDLVLDMSGLAPCFSATVSSEEVPKGKPSPDVYLEAAARLGVDPTRCAGVEDSSNGLRAVANAGMAPIAFPNAVYPPAEDALALAVRTLGSMSDLHVDVIVAIGDGVGSRS